MDKSYTNKDRIWKNDMHTLETAEYWHENYKNKTEHETRNPLQRGNGTTASDKNLSLWWLALDQAWTADLWVFNRETWTLSVEAFIWPFIYFFTHGQIDFWLV